MTGQGVKERNRAARRAKVVCNWSYSKEATLGFRKLMRLLLQQRRNQIEMDNGHKDDATE